ncbi:hypothetical protein PMAYCL1PPCAC_19382, partial [Pristionchus mayeri]
QTTVDSGSRSNLNPTPNSILDTKEKAAAAATVSAAAAVPSATTAHDDVTTTSSEARGDSSKEGHADDIEPPLAYRELTSSSAVHATREYLDQLFWDKNELRQSPAAFRHVTRLIDSEISRVVEQISSTLASSTSVPSRGDEANPDSSKVVLQEKIFVPVDKYPRYNFVGRILGPRGMTAKQLEEETGCKIMVRGRGSCRTEPLHVLIHAEDTAEKVEMKLKKAVERINQLLTPPPEGKDELKRKQLIELSIINGTYRPTTATKLALQAPRMPTTFSNAGSPSSGPLAGLDPSIFSMLGDPSKRRMLSSFGLPPPSSGSDLSSPHSPPASPRHNAGSGAPASLLDDNQAYLASLLAASNTNAFSGNSIFSDYYRQLVAMSLADPSLLSYGMPPHDLLASLGLGGGSGPAGSSSSPHPPSSPGVGASVPPPAQYGERPGSAAGGAIGHHHGGAMGIGAGTGGGTGLIPPANMQQYLAAAAMLSGVPYLNDHNNNNSHNNNHHHNHRDAMAQNHRRPPLTHDGSGDAQVANMQALSVGPPTNPMGGAVKRA